MTEALDPDGYQINGSRNEQKVKNRMEEWSDGKEREKERKLRLMRESVQTARRREGLLQ